VTAGPPGSPGDPADPVRAVATADAALDPRRRRLGFVTTRPVAVLMIFVAVMVFGGFSIRLLPVNLMPDISYPKLTVRTEYPGAAPAEVENNIARPLEEMLGVVTGLTGIESVSRAGYCDVILEFAWDTDMDEANQDVLEKVDAVRPNLPDGVEPPLILRYDPTLDPVMTLSMHGEGERFKGLVGLKLLRRLADREVRRMLEPVPGVAAVKVKGGLEEEVHVDVDEDALRRLGIGIDQIVSRLQQENINLAGGTMRDGRTRYLVRTVNEFTDVEDIASIVVLRREGRDVRLSDLAKVTHGHAERDVITRVDGREAVEIEVYKEADANIVDMAARVRERVDDMVSPRLEDQFGATVAVASDRSQFIESSIAEVRDTAIIGGGLAVIVLLLFLRDLRSTAIVALSIPVSVLVTFAPLSLAGVSLNIMSLGGLAMGVGMLVDNSIVVLESIHRCRQEGDDLVAATLRGTEEVGGAVTASTLTTVAVFFPMVFVEGVAGQMFGDLGLAVVFSLLASLAVALFLIPMLASRAGLAGRDVGGFGAGMRLTWGRWASGSDLRRSLGGIRRRPWLAAGLPYVLLRFVLHAAFDLIGKVLLTLTIVVLTLVLGVGWLVGRVLGVVVRPVLWIFGQMVDLLENAYPPVVRWSLRNRVIVYVASIGTFVLIGWGMGRLDSELIPELHQGEFTAQLKLPVGTPLPSTDEIVQPLEAEILERTPGLVAHTATIGSQADEGDASERGEHTARLRLDLERPKGGGLGATESAERIEAEALAAVREALADVPDLAVTIARPVLFTFKAPVVIEVRGNDLGDLAEGTRRVAEELRGLDGLRDVEASIQPGSPEVHIVYDRDAIARLGLDVRAVAERVRAEVQGEEATKLTRLDRKIPIRVRLANIDAATLDELRDLVVNPGSPRLVPLSAVAELEVGRGPNEIRRIGQQRVGIVTANVEGMALGGVARRIDDALSAATLPDGVTTAITGQSEEWETSSRSLYLALGLSVFLVYVIMASQFESLVYPLLILVTIPLAFAGVVVALLLLDMPVSVVVFLGAIMLAGIVVNNAIVLVDYTGTLKARGMTTEAALEMAGRVRLRPILMTTLTTMLGLLPMALGLGDGAEIRTPMAITVIAGLGLSTILTLVVIPTLYAGVDRLRGAFASDVPIGDRLDRELADVRAEHLSPEDEDDDA
jgi:HAE1 family hydrophobic/amphiphilic exporter-1